MAYGPDRHSGNPLTPQVQHETVARMAPECTPAHQGQSHSAYQQAGYRDAVHSPFPVTSHYPCTIGGVHIGALDIADEASTNRADDHTR
jgi:hypothetical protein